MHSPEISLRTFKMMGRAMADAFLVPFRDLPRVLFHAAILSVIIGGFWLLDALKDPILSAVVGIEYQPYAKLMSVVFTIVIVCCYDFLTSNVTKPSLFHIISISFGIIFMIIAAILSHPTTGLDNKVKSPSRMIGWFCYFAIEVYGSLMVALFWSFTNSLMDLEQAKGAYGLIICIAQVGAIGGSTLATHAATMGIPQLFLIASVSVLCVSLLIKIYHIVFRDNVTRQVEEHRVRRMTGTSEDLQDMLHYGPSSAVPPKESLSGPSPISRDSAFCSLSFASGINIKALLQSVMTAFAGFYDGLVLIVKYPYVLHILGVTCLYEIVLTVMDYRFKLLGSLQTSAGGKMFHENSEDTNDFANLLGHFGQFTNLLSLFVSSVGFSFLVHRIGVRYTLLVFPVVLFFAVVITNLVPSLWVMFVFVSILKAMVYSLMDPVVELLYMPTSEPIKFKAKAWIDVLGARAAKALGSLISGAADGDPRRLRHLSEMPSIIISLVLIVVVFNTGRQFDKLVRDGTIVGNEEDDDVGMELNSLKHSSGEGAKSYYDSLQPRNGLRAGDVGYDGYDLHLFDGVFPTSSDEDGGGDRHQQQIEGDHSSAWQRTRRKREQERRDAWYDVVDSGVLRDENGEREPPLLVHTMSSEDFKRADSKFSSL